MKLTEPITINFRLFPMISNQFQSIPITFIKIMGDETRSGKGSCQGCRSCAADWDNPRSAGAGMRQRQKMSRLKVSAARTNRVASAFAKSYGATGRDPVHQPWVNAGQSPYGRVLAANNWVSGDFRRFPEISNHFFRKKGG